MKILVSGGHLTPALAFIEYVKEFTKDEVVFVGRRYAQQELKQKSREKEEVTARGVQFVEFSTGKLSRFSAVQLLQQGLGFLSSLPQARKILKQLQPDVFVSFGGYLAVPLALMAKLARVPVITHEQTRAAGVANRFIALLANTVAVSYDESIHFFPVKKVVVTGNPIRRTIISTKPILPDWLPKRITKPILYVTGGSQGSHVMNVTMMTALPFLTNEWFVIHQCGKPTLQMNYQRELEKVRQRLPGAQQQQYVVHEWVDQHELAWIYQNAMAIVSRAGANTVQELILAGKPAIFVPLAYAHADEQQKNAEAVERMGSAMVVSQKELTPGKLVETLKLFQRQYPTLLQHAEQNRIKYPVDADQRLYEVVKNAVAKVS